MSYRVILYDILPLQHRSGPARFMYQFEVEDAEPKGWRQLAPYNGRYFQTSAGNWELITDRYPLVTFKGGMQSRNTAYHAMTFNTCRNGRMNDFPRPGQYGTGVLFEARDNIRYPMTNVLWYVAEKRLQLPDPRYLWIGGGGKYGGQAVAYRREALHGWLFNAADFSRKFYLQMETNGAGLGLGGSCGATLLLATAQNPSALVNQVNEGWDFNLSFAGKIDDAVKAIAAGKQYKKVCSELGRFAIEVHNRAGVIGKTFWEEVANTAKTIFTGLSIDWRNPTITALDIPKAGLGLEAGVVYNWSKVTMISPF